MNLSHRWSYLRYVMLFLFKISHLIEYYIIITLCILGYIAEPKVLSIIFVFNFAVLKSRGRTLFQWKCILLRRFSFILYSWFVKFETTHFGFLDNPTMVEGERKEKHFYHEIFWFCSLIIMICFQSISRDKFICSLWFGEIYQ